MRRRARVSCDHRVASAPSNIVIVAEGDEEGGAFVIADKVRDRTSSYDIRVSVLGHIQRGGSPTANDRILASRTGVAAVEAMLKGQSSCMVGLVNDEIAITPFKQAIAGVKTIQPDLMRVLAILSI